MQEISIFEIPLTDGIPGLQNENQLMEQGTNDKAITHAIVMPCYNEALRLKIPDIRTFLDHSPHIMFCFVNDGSTDNTMDILQLMKDHYSAQVHIVDINDNRGKAEAVRQGMQAMLEQAWPDHIGFLDADLSTGLEEYEKTLQQFISGNSSMTFASRISDGARNIHYSPFRLVTSKIARFIIKLILRLPVKDTQCGAKIFSMEAAAICFREPFTTRWLMDAEIFLRLKKHYGKSKVMGHLQEVYLDKWVYERKSKLEVRELLSIPYQFLQIILHYNIRKLI